MTVIDDDDGDIDPADRDALERAMEVCRLEPARDEQLQSKLREESWFDVAAFAASCAQSEALRLKPWRSPPCDADEDEPDPHDPAAQSLLRAMLNSGLSRFEPDPLNALAKRRRRRKASRE